MTRRKLIPVEGETYGYLIYLYETDRIVRPSKSPRAGMFKCVCGNDVKRPLGEVVQGSITSCGCMKGKAGIKDISGKKFNKLTAIESTGQISNGGYIWRCICDCGNSKELPIGALVSGSVQSCGCAKGTHKMTNTATYRSWRKMLDRTRNEEYAEWHGDVKVDSRWDNWEGGSFENFLEDMGERPEGTTLNRINGAKVYSKDTCEWATLSVQSFDQKRSKVNTSGRTGVYQVKETGRWVAQIKKNRVVTEVYRGDSFEEACAARTAAEIEYYGFSKE